jgi:predicted amidohydrolase YtcJ
VVSLEAGKFADIVMLSHNPLTVDPDEIPSIGVLMTMVNGRVAYCEENHDLICPD